MLSAIALHEILLLEDGRLNFACFLQFPFDDVDEETLGKLQRIGSSHLDFEQQCINLQRAYSPLFFQDAPLLPPYAETEVVAWETQYGFGFPPLLRFYMLSISRKLLICRSCNDR